MPRMSGPTVMIAISATSSRCRTKLPQVSPRLSSRCWPRPSSSGCCASRRSAWTHGRPASAAFGTSTAMPPKKTGSRWIFFDRRLGSTQTLRPRVTATHSPCNGTFGTSRPALSSRFRGRPGRKRCAPCRSMIRTLWPTPSSAHMMMWGGEWEEAIAQARTAFALNPNSAFVISMLGCVLGFGGHREEALERLRQAMRASPHDPLIWLWTLWSGSVQFYARDFAAALETLRELIRLRPSAWWIYELAAGALAFLGRRDEARDMLRRMPTQPPEQLARFRHRPPWLRPEDYALRCEGLRLATDETL